MELRAQEHEHLNASFADFRFHYEKAVSGRRSGGPDCFRGMGTHTGKPYAYCPCEPIEAKGTKVLNDPEEAYFFFRDGEDHIARIIICAKEEMTGPPGIYTQIGGFPMM